jgi:hypothetical protein
LVELIITDHDGNGRTPSTPNTAWSTPTTVTDIRRGTAIQAFDPGDFLALDLNPGVGGPGFTVGYVSDLDSDANKIPATPAGNPCAVNEILVVELHRPPCPEYALYFGSEATEETLDIGGGSSYSIGALNIKPVTAFQFGVRSTTDDDTTTWAFSGELGAHASQIVAMLFTDEDGTSRIPGTPNTAQSSPMVVAEIRRGAAVEGLSPGDSLEYELEPEVGGPGFYVGYTSDLDGNTNRIPATAEREPCLLNELLIVELTPIGNPQLPGDCNQDGELDVADAVCIFSILFSGAEVTGLPPGEFACGDGSSSDPANRELLDWNGDDTSSVDLGDGIALLNFFFYGGPPHVLGMQCRQIVGCPVNDSCPAL